MSNHTPEHLRLVAVKIIVHCGVRQWSFTRTDEDGFAYLDDGSIETADPVTVERLYTVAHECGHIALRHGPRKVSGHRGEYESEQFAALVLRRFELPVPVNEIEDGRQYVAEYIDNDVQSGCRQIDRDAYDWAAPFIASATVAAIQAGQVTLVREADPQRYEKLLRDFLAEVVDGLPDRVVPRSSRSDW